MWVIRERKKSHDGRDPRNIGIAGIRHVPRRSERSGRKSLRSRRRPAPIVADGQGYGARVSDPAARPEPSGHREWKLRDEYSACGLSSRSKQPEDDREPEAAKLP